ncbi:tetratricopeptide repeat protein [Candidatus Fermentibacteria bacterium]|nr:tetratricopeptide repeat protein [Candidatus Fermentibacteria bacterium]
MDRLIPGFITERYQRGEAQGGFEGSGLFVDIAGFSRLTDVAFTLGEVGAELIGREIPRLFETPVRLVIENGGIITHFAGDAFLALFPDDGGGIARRIGLAIIAHFDRHGRSETPHGTFDFAVKCGVDVGRVAWGIVQSTRHATWYFQGGPVAGATALERLAGRGEMICSDVARRGEVVGEGIHPMAPPNDVETLSAFFDEAILERGTLREIRRVVAAFLSFVRLDDEGTPMSIEDHHTLAALFKAVDEHLPSGGRAFGRLLIDDKGLNVLAYFGAPTALEHPEESALRFLFELRGRLSEARPDVRLRAGVDRGLVYAGLTGGTLRHERAFLGDCVNVSSRIMTGAPWGAIHASTRVVEAVGEGWAFTELPAVVFKGKSVPEPVFQLEGPREGPGIHTYLRPMIGRERELACLHRLLAPALRGEFAGMACVYGEAGMGKTRLVAEFRRQVEESGSHMAWVELPCGEDDLGLQPVRAWLHEFYGVTPFTSNQDKRTHIAARCAALSATPGVSEETSRELKRVESFVAALIECHWEGSLFEKVEDPKLRYDNQLWGLRQMIVALSASGPVVVHVEDAHWLESATAEWLGIMTRATQNLPLFILLTSRSAEDGTKPQLAAGMQAPVIELDLDRLDERLVRCMVRMLLGGSTDDPLVALLLERAEGNPFFVEQLVLHLYESEYLTRSEMDGRWGLSSPAVADEPGRLPGTLEAVLLARFDRLEASLREGLKHAATLGPRFLHRVLEELLGRSREFGAEPLMVIPQAEEHAMILPERTHPFDAEQAYLFRHALMQRAAYHLQPPGMREYLHGLAADVVEELFPKREDMLVILAEHLGKAGRREREAEVLEHAAAVAKRGYRNAEAIALYERLRDRLKRLGAEESERMVRALYSLAAVKWLVGDWRQAHDVTQIGCAIAERLGTDDLVVDGWVLAAEQLRNLGEPTCAQERAHAARDRATRCDYLLGIARALGVLGRLYWNQGEYQRALEAIQGQLCRADEAGNEAEALNAKGTLGIVLWAQGHHPQALECFRDWQKRAERVGDRRGVGRAIGNQGLVYWDFGDYDRALECYKEQTRQGTEVGDWESVTLGSGNSGNVYCEQGEYARALECFQEWQCRAEILGDRLGVSNAIGNQGNVCLHVGRYRQALQHSEEFVDRARALGDRFGIAFGLGQQGYAHLFLGDTTQALKCFRKALTETEESGDSKNAAPALLGMSMAHQHRNEYEQALACSQKSLAIASEEGSPNRISGARAQAAAVLLAMGRTAEAAAEAGQALEIARGLHTRPALIEPLMVFAEVQAREGDILQATNSLAEARQIAEDLGLAHRVAEIERVSARLMPPEARPS